MRNKKIKGLILSFLIMIIFSGCENKIEQVRSKIENSLLKDYGEEFVVDRIGMRSANGKKFYQARIYPKSIIGTPREDDKYYYKSASIDIRSFGKLSKNISDDYIEVKVNEEVENYLLPKARKLFGKRIRIKTDVKYKELNEYDTWQGFLQLGFEKTIEEVQANQEKKRIELSIYIYIFDRIDNEEEKEKRRKEIFDYVQYLKEEGLFKYLEMGVIFIDERVLTPSYAKYRKKIGNTDTVEEMVNGEKIYLPPMELREEMSKVLQSEGDRMSEQEKLDSMNRILKSDLALYGGRRYLVGGLQINNWVESIDYLKNKEISTYEKLKENEMLKKHYYKNLDDLELKKNNDYIFLGEE